MIVAVKLARMTLAGRDILFGGTVHKKDVDPPVVVEIEERGASAQRVHDPPLVGGPAGKVKIKTRGSADVLKCNAG